MELAEQELFAPASTDMVDGLIGRYRSERERMERVVDYLSGDDFKSVVGYFEDYARQKDYRAGATPSFNLDHGLAALNASYWRRALDLTDVLDFMPTERREEWFEQIRKMDTPEFEESTVRATLAELLAGRMNFLAEKVDGIFRALSKTHITNQPEGFGKRMILTGVTNDWGAYGRTQTGHLNDLRQVIAKFMGRDEPDWNASNRVVEIARANYRGEWLAVDGGALRIRCFKNGNAHMEVHPDMAWRLNEILAHLYPAAIPSRFRTAPKQRKKREYVLMERPLPFAVLEVLHRLGRVYDKNDTERRLPQLLKNAVRIESHVSDKRVIAETEQVLQMLGGVRQNVSGYAWWQFDYDPSDVIAEIVCSGCIPDHKSHQFYPTPESIARDAVEIAEIGPEHDCLEPSAGTGNLADAMAKIEYRRLCCIEISKMHCEILKSKHYFTVNADFLSMSNGDRFDRIVMNPPYSQGRWQAHIEHAATMLRPDGILVAILPASARGKDVLPGMKLTWSRVYENQFRGASVDVVIMRAEHEQTA